MEVAPKKRTTNFTASEEELLITLVKKYKSVLECLKTDAVNANSQIKFVIVNFEFIMMNKRDLLLLTEDVSDNTNISKPTNMEEKPLILTNAIHVIKDNTYYDMNHKFRGKAVIINNDTFNGNAKKLPNRGRGTNADIQSLESMLFDLNFEVLIWNNFVSEDLKYSLTNLAKKDHSKNDCLVVFVMTYGIDETTYIYAKNEKYIVDLLWNNFTANICPTLAGKPKLFFIHAPCVDMFDCGVLTSKQVTTDVVDSSYAFYKIPLHTDFLITFNSYNGYYSFENPEKGSLFIQSLCNIIKKHDFATTDVLKIMTRVAKLITLKSQNDTSLHEQKRVSIIQSTLIKNVYFTPKMVSTPQPKLIDRKFISEEYLQKENVLPICTTIIEDMKSLGYQFVPQMSITKDASHYKMDHESRGYAVIINNNNFEGAAKHLPDRDSSKDVEYLQTLFHRIKFEVLIWNNFYLKDLMASLSKLAEKDHSKNDCLAIAISTHGSSSFIYAKDSSYSVDNLWNTFSADKCPSLAGKPKMFFIQACRGDKSDCGVMLNGEINTEVNNSNAYYTIPTQYPDFLIAFSSYDGYTSFRHPKNGSWFFHSLFIEMEKNDVATIDILSILTCVIKRVALYYKSYNQNPLLSDQKQLPTIHSTLIEDLYFIDNKNEQLPDPKQFNKTFVSLTLQEENLSTIIEKEEKFLNFHPSNVKVRPKLIKLENLYKKTTSSIMKSIDTIQMTVTEDASCSNMDCNWVLLNVPSITQKTPADIHELVPNISALNITAHRFTNASSNHS